MPEARQDTLPDEGQCGPATRAVPRRLARAKPSMPCDRQFISRTERPDDLTGALAFLASDDPRELYLDAGGFGF